MPVRAPETVRRKAAERDPTEYGTHDQDILAAKVEHALDCHGPFPTAGGNLPHLHHFEFRRLIAVGVPLFGAFRMRFSGPAIYRLMLALGVQGWSFGGFAECLFVVWRATLRWLGRIGGMWWRWKMCKCFTA